MGKVYTTSEDLTSIANAIRAKAGTNSSLVYPTGFVSAIGSIGIVEEKDVNFYDYDGTLVYSYTATEFASLSVYPANPTHTGLTAQGWNWDLADAKSFVATYRKLDIGQMYVTASGKTEIDITLDDPNFLSPYLSFSLKGTIEIDWGDNSSIDTIQGTSLYAQKFQQHIYNNIGSYIIKINVTDGTFSFINNNGGSGTGILQYSIFTTGQNKARNTVYSKTITAVRIGNNTQFKSAPFSNCMNMKYITIPSTITSIPSSAFEYCISLRFIIIPKNVTTIESYTFNNCHALIGVSLSKITTVGSYSFQMCMNLLKIILPDTTTSINTSAFSSCYTLKSIIIPSSITDIGNYTFSGCYQLKINYTFPSQMTKVPDSIFNNCYFLKSVQLPSEATSIGSNAFAACKQLQSLSIPSKVTVINGYAFNYCVNLTSLTIPSTVTEIKNYAFQYCNGIMEYHFLPTSPPTLGTNVFSYISEITTIYVPYSSDHSILDAYKAATNWSTWADYIQEEPAP